MHVSFGIDIAIQNLGVEDDLLPPMKVKASNKPLNHAKLAKSLEISSVPIFSPPLSNSHTVF